jgi:tRNA(Ile)-lysidine synthetase-like protein
VSNPAKNILKKVKESLTQFLPENCETLVLGLSGGADSIALALLIMELHSFLGVEIHAVHVNHGLRGKESDQDAEFVRIWCEEKNLSLTIIDSTDVKKLAEAKDLSLEESAREIRYDIFWQEASKFRTPVILTAHTLDDDIETLLMRLFLGASLKSLSGIREITEYKNVPIIRPMLKIKRQEIIEYLQTHNETWCEDSSNLVPDVLRNKIRLEILPFIEKTLSRDIKDSLGKTLDNIKRENDLLEMLLSENEVAETIWKKFDTFWKVGFCASVHDMKATHPALRYRFVRWALDSLKFETKRRKSDIFKMFDNFLIVPGGKRSHHIGENIYLARSSNAFIIAKQKSESEVELFNPIVSQCQDYLKSFTSRPSYPFNLNVNSLGSYDFLDWKITVEKSDSSEIIKEDSTDREWTKACFDVSILDESFRIITGGDFLREIGRYKIRKDILEEFEKIGNRLLVDFWLSLPVFVHGSEIIWIPGAGKSEEKNCQLKCDSIVISVGYPDYMTVFFG